MTEENVTSPRRVGTPSERTDVEKSERKDTRYLTTLGEQDAKLPIGILFEGSVHREVVFKRWRTKDERELGKQVAPDTEMSEHISLVVSNMCSRIGNHKLDEMDAAQKALAISMMYMGDVFYVYSMLRRREVGENLDVQVSCPRRGCGVEFPYSGKLSTLEVAGVEHIDDILWTYDLKEPIEIRKELVTRFNMSYPKWSLMKSLSGVESEVEIKVLTVQTSIIGINDGQEPLQLAPEELDELTRQDLEGIVAAINDGFLGPKLGVEGECTPQVCTKYKRGGHPFAFNIDWDYKRFFAHSSP